MDLALTLTVIATAVSVAGCMAVAGLWVLRAVIAKDVKPVGDTVITLTNAVQSLTTTLLDERESRREERKEMQHVVRDLEMLVRDLDRRTTRLESYHPPPRG